tara:strand:- start:3365 stop:4426 length:1062 start_codon:yes stop_codon:yes gene_type:complete
MKVLWSKPDFLEEELSAAYSSLQNYIGGNGPNVEKLEKEFAESVGSKYAIAVNNGTSALLVSLMCLREELGPDKTVGVPSFTFIASANSSKEIFDNVKLLECEGDTWNLDPNKIDDSVDLLMAVDVGGLSCDYSELSKLNLPIIGDSAESLGSTFEGKLVGTQADLHCFSMHRAKIVSCGEGGMITTNSEKYRDLAHSFTNHGYCKDKRGYEYCHDNFGLNFRMSDVHAAIGRVQLRKLEQYVSHRNHIANIYKDELKGLVKFQSYDDKRFKSNYFFFGVLCEKRDEVIQHMLSKEVEVKTWTSVHKQPIWHSPLNNLPISGKISDEIVLLPIHNTITGAEVEYVIEKLKEIL